MKKNLLFVAGLLICMSSIAEDKLIVEPVTIPQGGMAEVSVILDNPNTQYAGFQFQLTLPEGVDIVKEGDEAVVNIGDRLSGNSFKNFSVTAKLISTTETKYQILGYQTTTVAFPGTTGCIMTIPLEASSELEVGTTVSATMTIVQVSDPVSVSYDLPDVSFDINIDEPGLKFDENSSKLPIYNNGDKANITMKRTIKAGEWSTIVLPFTLTQDKAKSAFGEDVQLAVFKGFEVDYGDDEENVVPLEIKIILEEYTLGARKSMTGGKPFLIKTSKDIESFTAEDVTLSSEVTDTEAKDEWETEGKLTGTFIKTKIPADGLFLNGNHFWYSTGNTNVKAFRCWFELGAVLDKDTDFGARITMHFDDNEASGISDMTGRQLTEDRYFDLQGRPVLKPANGVYIKDGKKVVVK